MLPYISCQHVEFCMTKWEQNLRRVNNNEMFTFHSSEGALKEAESWFESLPLKKISLVCLYGVGLGYYYELALLAWLKQNRKKRLVIFEDDLEVVYKFFETEKAERLLKDPQVQLIYFHDLKKDEVFEGFYWNFAMKRMTVSALKCYHDQKETTYKELCHKIAYDAAMKNALVDEYLRFGLSFYVNFYQNMLCLAESHLGTQFFGKFSKVPAIICGAGPSLAKNLPLLGTLLDRALIFAGGSALNVLNAANIQPHFGAGIDPNAMQYERLNSNQSYELPFFYRNRMFHKAFKMIHGPRLYITGSGGYDTAEYFEKKFKIEEEFLDEGHNVVNFCVEIANAMGCDPIIFVGMDLALQECRNMLRGC